MRRIVALGIALAVGVGAVLLVAGQAESKTTRATVKTRTTDLGKVLVDGKGHTLYLWVKDKHGKSACTGACATAWPPLLTTGKAKAGGTAKASQLGTTRRSDGTRQVTYNGHPLYTFIGDKGKAGSTAGQGSMGFGAAWWVVAPSGKAIKASASASPTPTPGGGSVY